ncbi:YihY/virulence factor BrkB family protein [Gracilibacillus sp. YIM 98692]|uniref:YihY/virulence factor BrkB family protein n=1 Tax=Gracilibacillus sp. YIM 98692 TaxID=2663532 RepID=UPI0013D19A47|nr:YihY/virulence factor BrkB family protein [Gracilibacillus sp. YIM 98692]
MSKRKWVDIPAVSFMKQLMKRFADDDIAGLAAQLSYFFVLSLFPFIIFLVTLVGYLPFQQIDFIQFISTYAPQEITHLIENNVTAIIDNRNGGLLSVGIIGTLWSASIGINAIIRSFNRAYNIDEERSFIRVRVVSIVLTFAMLLVIIIAFLLPIFGRAIGVSLFSIFGLSETFLQWWNALRWVISSVIFFIVLITLYLLAPSKKVHVKDVFIGALFSTIFWQLTSLAFSLYVSKMGNYSATYGSLGGVIILMIWFYLSGIIIIVGGEINALKEKMRQRNSNEV